MPLTSWALQNIFLLAMQWCCGIATFFIQVSTTSLAAADVTGSTSASTVPIGLMLTVAAIMASLIPHLVSEYGPRMVLSMAAAIGLVGAVLNLIAVLQTDGQFPLLVVGGLLQGINYAAMQYLRFAVIPFAPPEFVPYAVAYLLAGGVLAAGIGPEITKYTHESLPKVYAGSFVLLCGLYCCMIALPCFVDFEMNGAPTATINEMDSVACDGRIDDPDLIQIELYEEASVAADRQVELTENKPAVQTSSDIKAGRTNEMVQYSSIISSDTIGDDVSVPCKSPVTELNKEDSCTERPRTRYELVFRWQYILLLWIQMASYGAMTGLMIATPISMKNNGFSFKDSTSAIELHMVAMFLPALVTGDIVKYAGPVKCMLFGFCVMLTGALYYCLGSTREVFMTAISVVGLGWNFSFIPVTAILPHCFNTPEEKVLLLSVNDFCIVSCIAVVMITAGVLLDWIGWDNFVWFYSSYIAVTVMIVSVYCVYRTVQNHPIDDVLAP